MFVVLHSGGGEKLEFSLEPGPLDPVVVGGSSHGVAFVLFTRRPRRLKPELQQSGCKPDVQSAMPIGIAGALSQGRLWRETIATYNNEERLFERSRVAVAPFAAAIVLAAGDTVKPHSSFDPVSNRPADRAADPRTNGNEATNGDSHSMLQPEKNGESAPILAPHPDPEPRKRHLWRWLLLIALAAGAWYGRSYWIPWVNTALGRNANGPAARPSRPVPVRTATVVKRDLDLYLNGLGTVTAFKTVTLKSRVDGELIKVAFTEGQMVNEGDLLAEIDPRPFEAQLEQAEGTLAKDSATLELARLNLDRVKELRKKNSIAQQQVDEQVAAVQQMEGTVQTDSGMVANARLQLKYCKIIAPVTGRIGLRLVDQGNIVHASDVMGMAVITQLQPIAVVFPISQDEIPRVQRKMNAGNTLAVYAYDRGFNTRLATGKLYAIDNQVDATTGTVKFKAIFENEDNMLFPNQFVNARLLVDTLHDAVIVPSAAVQRGPNGMFVYVVQPDDKVHMQTVVTGEAEGAETAVATGLVAGDVVVTDGIDKLKEGSEITTQEKEREKAKRAEAGQGAGAGNAPRAEKT
jgi:multidrug efflux system membrane fusion protein